jgi:hypothetical protein
MALDVKRIDRVVDLASVFLISIAAVMTAVCGYQSGRWGGIEARLYSVADANRIASAREAGKSDALAAIDADLFLQYIDAVQSGDSVRADFLSARFPPDFKRAFDAWVATRPLKNPKAPSSPFTMPDYKKEMMADARRDEAAANADFQSALTATRNADAFLLLTVVFSGVSFMAGMSTKMQFPYHLMVVCVGVVGVVYGTIRIVRLPFA